MNIAIKRYLLCLGAICVLMAAYCAVVVPLLQPPPRESRPTPLENEQGSHGDWWRNLFPAEAWQNNSPMVMQTEQGTLLFQNLEQIELDKSESGQSSTDGRGSLVRLRPLTLIVPMSREAKSVVLGDLSAAARVYSSSPLAIVVANEGADIQFRETPDWTNQKSKPQVIGGQLKGLIQIAGIDPRKTSANGGPLQEWFIQTSHVRIEGRRVWTNNEVEISSANTQAVGQGLSFLLKQDLLSPGADPDGPWGLLEEMELNSLRQVDVKLPPGGLWKDLNLGPAALAQAHANVPARLQLYCKRNFRFFFNESRGVLTDHVRMEHRFEGEETADEFKCHELTFKFASPSTPPSPNDVMVGPMKLHSIDALGIDSVGPLPAQSSVEIQAPNIAAKLDAKRLQVLMDTRRFIVSSHNGRSSENSRVAPGNVFLSYLGNNFHAPDLDYLAAPNDEHPGWFQASGPGHLETSPESEAGHVTARWQKELRMLPHEQHHVILMQGRSLIESPARGHLIGDRIDIRLSAPPAASTNRQATSTKPAGSSSFLAGGAGAYQVERVDALGDIDLGNSSQRVQVKQLHIKFLYPEKLAAAAAAAAEAASTTPGVAAPTLDLANSSGKPTHQFASPPRPNSNSPGTSITTPLGSAPTPPPLALPLTIPADTTSTTVPGGAPVSGDASRASSMPILVLGNDLHSQIIVTSQRSWIDNLQINGNVVVSRDGPAPPDALPWRVDGNQLQLESDAEDKFNMQVVGSPARVTMGDGWIVGPIICLNQRTGQAWIDHPGSLSLPSKLMQSSKLTAGGTAGNGPTALNPIANLPGSGSNVEWLEPVKVSWKGRMLFNGTTANMEGNIEINGYAKTAVDRMLLVQGACEALQVRLTRPVNVGQPGNTSATVQSVTLSQNVELRSAQTTDTGQRLSLERISVPELTYELATNRILGKGPGTIHSQHLASGGIGSLVSSSQAAPPGGNSGAMLRSNQPQNVQGLNLKFRDLMEAQLTNKLITFLGKVEVGIGPIDAMTQMLQLDDMRSLKMNQALISGDLLRIIDASDVTRPMPGNTISGTWEFEAQGNVVFESRNESGDLFGKAYRMNYVQAKDLLIIKGDTRIPAEVRLKPEKPTSFSLAIMSLWSGSINTKTLEAGPTGSGGEGELQLAQGTHFIPRTTPVNGDQWKWLNPAPNAAGGGLSGNQTGSTPGLTTPPITRPRDGAQDFFQNSTRK